MTEKRFEEYIEKYLTSTDNNGLVYTALHFSNYDRTLCLLPAEVLAFLQSSQPESYERWQVQFGEKADEKLLQRLSTQIEKDGLIKVLREGIKDRAVYFDMTYFEPKSGLNPEHQAKYLCNRLSIVRQLHYSKANEKSIDIVLFINGIPIIGIELKNQLSGQDISHASRQYQFDRDPKNEPLLQFKRMLVHFIVDNDTVGMASELKGPDTRFWPYNRDIVNPIVANDYKVSYLWKEVLSPNSVLDIIENFVLETTETEKEWDEKLGRVVEKKKDLLIFPRYHQLDVIRKLKTQIKAEGAGHYYLIQHTTGSGKSYSIGWLAHTLTSLYQNSSQKTRLFDTIIVVTDRKVLDKQLQKTLRDLEQTAGVVKAIDKNSEQLKDALAKGNDIVVTTIQKFGVIADAMSKLKGRTFGVIIDEVHSSQTGETAKKLKKSLSFNEFDEDEEEDYEDILTKELLSRGRQKHISFFGFTGTPKNKTLELFGRKNELGQFVPFHSYSMKQSIFEGYTLDVLAHYMPYKRWFKLKQEDGKDDLELPEGKVKRELMNFVDSHPETIRQKVAIILNQFMHQTQKQIRGKARAMVVVRSRKHCVLYQQEMLKQMKALRLPFSCLVAFSGSIQKDGKEHTEGSLNTENGLQGGVSIPDGLKDPRFRILIVSNKYQTGFDEPFIHTMFVDKRLGGVQCVQTLSRLNRKATGKTDTFVLDFVNQPEEIIEAFQPFYTSTILTGETDSYKLYELDSEIKSFHLFTKYELDEFCQLFFSERKSDEAFQPYLNRAVEKWQEIELIDKREEYRSLINAYCRLYSYISQIMDFQDAELEKLFIFLKYLKKKLPKRIGTTVDITDAIDLESLRLQKQEEMKLKLDDKAGELDPMAESGAKGKDAEENSLLSEIIRKINEVHGVNLKEEDRIHLNNVYIRMSQSAEIRKVMEGDNSEANKRQYWNEMMSKIFLEYINDNFDFYKTVESPGIKPNIADLMYRQYMGMKFR
ncbi:type I restriction endonuclease subunit R [Emticicia sp. 21SJ11W-3]|uniref:type I restriction endonuclease subunit R n=1 Tax=Emticicia sp. 21SJ11W-3 TaxID=2916755 RepID=UPI00209C7505|nr:DEAD/DEAH box helicase family protein [Emticicia sp. 21SJ11W-3]UTA66514.1 DEAD/DEAH box helicase family protein [Emticicia sp. 21SJ11W-3]